VETLRRRLRVSARVLREATWQVTPSRELVPGDIVRVRPGDIIPADVKLLTGAKTQFARTTELVQQARPTLHLEAVVAKVVRWLFVIVGALLGIVIVLSLMRGAPLLEMVPLMLVLLMSAVPVALPVMFTASMVVGAKELAMPVMLGVPGGSMLGARVLSSAPTRTLRLLFARLRFR
jgi:H+-transporting ATPase